MAQVCETDAAGPTRDMIITDPTSDADKNPTLFQITIEIMVKDFMSQKIGSTKGTYQVNVNTLDEFLQCAWSMVEENIQREILYNEETECYEWANYELDVESIGRFATFYDRSSKRTTEVLNITNKVLNSWTKKSGLICNVLVYGSCLKKKQHYDKAYKQVIQPDATDRAGAVNNAAIFACIDELKALHSDLLATEASWLRWANWIKKQPGHNRETQMHQDPPASLLELFKLVRRESDHIQEVRSSVLIGKRVNKSIESALPMIESEIADLVELFKSGLRRSERLQALIESLKSQLASNDNLMDGFNEALGPQEDAFSAEYLHDIDNIDDIDHQQ